MTFIHYGEELEPRDVLDDQEGREYALARRQQAGSFKGPLAVPLRINEDGYDQFGGYHFDRELER